MEIILVLIELYVVPLILAVGLIYFIYGVLNYYVIGPGDEGRREIGRQSLLKAMALIFIGVLLFLFVLGINRLVGAVSEKVDVDVERDDDILQVPDVPTR